MIDIKETIKDALSKFWTGYQKNVVDSLDSQSSILPLSANMGYKLNAKIYPVGSIFIWSGKNNSVVGAPNLSNSPDLSSVDKMSAYFGGTWVQISSRFLYGCGGDEQDGDVGGKQTVTLSVNNLPKHTHVIPSSIGTTKSEMGLPDGGHDHSIRGYQGKSANGSTGFRPGGGGSDFADSIVTSTNSTHTHRVVMPASNTKDTGAGVSFGIMPPLVAVYIYQRVA